MTDSPLVPIQTLLPLRSQLDALIAQLNPPMPRETGEAGDALAWSLLFQHWPDLLPTPPLSADAVFYNQYFWFKRFATLKQMQDGYDAGLEQQAFQLLDSSALDLDWDLLEQLDAEATNISK